MAQASNFTITTSSEMVGVPEDITDAIFELAPYDTKLLTAVGMNGFTATNTTHKYQDIQTRPARTTVNEALDNSETDVTFAEAVFQAGEIVQVDEELILLGTDSGDSLTFTSCTRSAGAGAAAAHDDAAPAVSYGKPRTQGAAASTTGDLVIMPDTLTTYTQIFSKTVITSDTAQALARYGRPGSEYQYQAARQMKVLKKELEHALIWAVATAPATTATAGQMDGLYERLVTNSTTDLAGVAIDIGDIETGVETARDYDSLMDLLCVSLYSKRVIDAWGQAYVSHPVDPNDPVNATFGTLVSRLNIGGALLNLLDMNNLHAHAIGLDSTKVRVGPLQGRGFAHKFLGSDGDRTRGMIIGEYTAEVPCDKAHQFWTSVKFA